MLRQRLPVLDEIAERSHIFKLTPINHGEVGDGRAIQTPNSPFQTPSLLEAAWLGIDPRSVRMAQGPLTLAALGADPPERSVHFHLSLLAFDEGLAEEVRNEIPEDQLRIVLDAARRLDTKKITLVAGEGADHGLVWEGGSIEMSTWRPTGPPRPPAGFLIGGHLPEGDGEGILRRYIDDSINLLSELAVNDQRIEEGLQPLNLLWPWGQGFREPVPNLLLQRGERAWVESGSMRLEGLTRLVGYRHGDRGAFGKGTNTRLDELADMAWGKDPSIVVIDAIAEMRRQGKIEEAAWLTEEISSRFIRPMWDNGKNDYLRLLILAPALDQEGLALSYEPGYASSNAPFDERGLEQPGLEQAEPWRLIERTLTLA